MKEPKELNIELVWNNKIFWFHFVKGCLGWFSLEKTKVGAIKKYGK
jgi:hypothetical protein